MATWRRFHPGRAPRGRHLQHGAQGLRRWRCCSATCTPREHSAPHSSANAAKRMRHRSASKRRFINLQCVRGAVWLRLRHRPPMRTACHSQRAGCRLPLASSALLFPRRPWRLPALSAAPVPRFAGFFGCGVLQRHASVGRRGFDTVNGRREHFTDAEAQHDRGNADDQRGIDSGTFQAGTRDSDISCASGRILIWPWAAIASEQSAVQISVLLSMRGLQKYSRLAT